MTPALKQVLWKKNIQFMQLLQNNLMSDNDLTILYLIQYKGAWPWLFCLLSAFGHGSLGWDLFCGKEAFLSALFLNLNENNYKLKLLSPKSVRVLTQFLPVLQKRQGSSLMFPENKCNCFLFDLNQPESFHSSWKVSACGCVTEESGASLSATASLWYDGSNFLLQVILLPLP